MQQPWTEQLKFSNERSLFQDKKNSAGWYKTVPKQHR